MCRLFVGSTAAMWETETRILKIEHMVTPIRLEEFFWHVLDEIAERDGLSVNELLETLYSEAVEEGHNIGNFTSFLRVCCGRFLSLQLSGDVPDDRSVPIRSLNAESILRKERANWAQRHLHLVKSDKTGP